MAAWIASPGAQGEHREPDVPLDRRRRRRRPVRHLLGAGLRRWRERGRSPPPPPPAPPPAPPPPAAPPAPPAAPPAPPASPPKPPSAAGSPSGTGSPSPEERPPASTGGTQRSPRSAVPSPRRQAAQGVHADRRHKPRRTRLAVTKPHAGEDYAVHMSFGSVRVATASLAITCRAPPCGPALKGAGAIAGHVATCTWAIPAGADGKRLARHGQGQRSPRHLARAPREADRRQLTTAHTGSEPGVRDRCAVTARQASSSAVRCTARTIFWYPVQRQRLPPSAMRISSSLGCGLCGQQRGRGDQHARRAEAALHAALGDDVALQRMRLAPPCRGLPRS